MIDPFIRGLISEIDERKAQIAHVMTSGRLTNWEQYREKAGEYRGLETAAQIARELVQPLLDPTSPLKEAKKNGIGTTADARPPW